MKKLYTILAAAAVVMSASAAPVLSFQKATPKAPQAASISSIESLSVKDASTLKKAPRKADANGNPESGDYALWSYYRDYSMKQPAYEPLGASTFTINEDNTVTLDQFVYSDISFTGVYDPVAKTVTLPLNQSIEINDSLHFTIYEYELATKLAKPVVLQYDEEKDMLYYANVNPETNKYAGIVLLGALEWPIGSSNMGFYEIEYYPANAAMLYNTYDANGAIVEEQEIAFLNITKGDNTIEIENFGNVGFGFPMVLNINAEEQAITANKTMVVPASGQTPAFYLWADPTGDGNVLDTFNFTVGTTESGVPVMSYTGDIYICEETFNRGFVYANPSISLPFAPFDGASVDNVAADNAPVVYYNLQGMRVENPANGLFIRRQGNTATKVVK